MKYDDFDPRSQATDALFAHKGIMPTQEQLNPMLRDLAKTMYAQDIEFMALSRGERPTAEQDKARLALHMQTDFEMIAKSDQDRYINLAAIALTYVRERVQKEMNGGNFDLVTVPR